VFGPVWLYDVTFAPRDVVKIVHTYQVSGGGSVAGDRWVGYVTRTGAMWGGPIGSARFTFRVPYPTLLLRAPKDQPVLSIVRKTEGKKVFLEVVLAAKSWTPKDDLLLSHSPEEYFTQWPLKPQRPARWRRRLGRCGQARGSSGERGVSQAG
jgi:hypothetical protein